MESKYTAFSNPASLCTLDSFSSIRFPWDSQTLMSCFVLSSGSSLSLQVTPTFCSAMSGNSWRNLHYDEGFKQCLSFFIVGALCFLPGVPFLRSNTHTFLLVRKFSKSWAIVLMILFFDFLVTLRNVVRFLKVKLLLRVSCLLIFT